MKHRLTKEQGMMILKVILGGVLSSLLGLALRLKNPTSAGIVAILTILPYKKETIKTAAERFFAYGVSLLLAYLCFFMGVNVYRYLLFLGLYLLFCGIFKLYSSMSINAVLMAHFLGYGEMTGKLVLNETLIFIIGASLGIILNLTLLPSKEKFAMDKDAMDQQIKRILLRVSQRIKDPLLVGFDGSCLNELERRIAKAKETAEENRKNSFSSNPQEKEYLAMREKQMHILTDMVMSVSRIQQKAKTTDEVSLYLAKVSKEYAEDNDVSSLKADLGKITLKMKEEPLPQSREEFEERARLFHLLETLNEFLDVKREYMLRRKMV